MKPWQHAIGVLFGLVAPAALTLGMARPPIANDAPKSPREVVMAFDRLAFDDRKPEQAVLRYFSPAVVDHDPGVRGDRASIIAHLKGEDWGGSGPHRTIRHVLADGDLVAVHHRLVRTPGDAGVAAVDLFRVKDGLIVEHWDVLQPIPKQSLNPAPLF